MIYSILIVVHVIASIMLILVILLQAGRGGGLSEAFGMSSTQTFFGTSATKFLQRATSVAAIVFLLTCLSLAALSTRRSRSLMDSYKMPAKTQPADAKAQPVMAEPVKTEAAKQEIPKPE